MIHSFYNLFFVLFIQYFFQSFQFLLYYYFFSLYLLNSFTVTAFDGLPLKHQIRKCFRKCKRVNEQVCNSLLNRKPTALIIAMDSLSEKECDIIDKFNHVTAALNLQDKIDRISNFKECTPNILLSVIQQLLDTNFVGDDTKSKLQNALAFLETIIGNCHFSSFLFTKIISHTV